MSDELNKYTDFVAFLDDTNLKREVWCKVLDVNFFVVFELKSGKTISIPQSRVLKIKKTGGGE